MRSELCYLYGGNNELEKNLSEETVSFSSIICWKFIDGKHIISSNTLKLNLLIPLLLFN